MPPSRRPPTTSLDRQVCFRWTDYDTPFWVRPNREAQRWNRAGEAPTQYLSMGPDAAWAELARAEGLDTAGLAEVRMPIWAALVDQGNLVDYRTFERAEAAGFPPDALVDDDHERCRAEATRLRALGYAGVISPSAALPDATNVTLFGPRLLWSWGQRPVLAVHVAAVVVAVGRPGPGVAERVRLRGTPHEGAEAHARAGRGRGRG
jgi:hypothetical protein